MWAVTTTATGLSREEARRRLAEVGPNALPTEKPEPLYRRVLRQFQSALVYLLLFAVAFDLVLWVQEGRSGVPIEAVAIFAVLFLNAILGVLQEYRSESALSQLKSLSLPRVWVLRDETLERVQSDELVPDDVVRLEAGDRVPADGVVQGAQSLLVDESVLTGESMPVDKETGSELSSGTLVSRGHAFMRVSRTGAASTMGRLAGTLSRIETTKTPLERRLDKLGSQIARYIGAISVLLIVGGGLVEGWHRLSSVVLFVVALGVAAVPEGMPAVITLALAAGVQKMARRRAVVRRLAAVEGLGSVTVIATDKTGTLTENRMAVQSLPAVDRGEALMALVLANDAEDDMKAGDPLELGLLRYAHDNGVDIPALRRAMPRVGLTPFDSQWKYMRVTVKDGARKLSYLKGAPEVLIERSTLSGDERERWLARGEAEALAGHRVLGLARGEGSAEQDLEFLGLVTLWDPPREEVPAAIGKARAAGIRVIMITGDHPTTARTIAEKLGLQVGRVITGSELETMSPPELTAALQTATVFARTTADDKLRIVEALQKSGEIVAMTGDGVNDAPALKRADIGVAMGQRGSDVSREVSDLVLLDDNFATIVSAIEEGRIIYENIQKFIRFTFSTNVALMLIVLGAAVGSLVLGLRTEEGALLLPLTALQILWINFLGDGPPALALSVDRNPNVMAHAPRPPASPLLDRPSVLFILITGGLMGLCGLSLLLVLPAVNASIAATQTGIFLYASIAKLLNAYPARRLGSAMHQNRWLGLSIALGILLQLGCIAVVPLGNALGLARPSAVSLSVVLGAILVTWAASELTATALRDSAARVAKTRECRI